MPATISHKPPAAAQRTSRCLLHLAISLLLAATLILLVVGGVARAAMRGLGDPPTYDARVADAIGHVTTPLLVNELEGLTGERPVTVAGLSVTLATRYTFASDAISLATRYAHDHLVQSGLSVTYHYYCSYGYPLRNVAAEKPGRADPETLYLLTAHVDSISFGDGYCDPFELAPGADDNGTGSVAVLQAARLLAPYCFSNTLRFVLFTGEEQGLLGSQAYAASSFALGEQIAGVVNLDMIGYNTGTPVFDVYALSGASAAASESRLLAELVSDLVVIYGLDLVPHRIDTDSYPLVGGSDQWRFLELGYPAILIIEDYAGGDFTPYYHTCSDRVATLDGDYYREVVRAAVATLAHLGGLTAGDGALWGSVSGLESGVPVSATVALTNHATGGAVTVQADGGGVYSLTLPAGWYTLTVAPAPGYFPVTLGDVAVFCGSTAAQHVQVASAKHVYVPLILAAP